MQDGAQAFIRHSSLLDEASLSWGVPWQGASDAVGRRQGQAGSSKVSDFPPPVSFQIARKNSVMCIIITKCCIKQYPSAMLARRKSYLPNINANVVKIFKGFCLSLYCHFREHRHLHGKDCCMRASKI